MCGIAGGYFSGEQAAVQASVRDALHCLRRRGPDDKGLEMADHNGRIIALGHTRLSIIDLSINGHQPMRSSDGQHSIVFNGEIYNYRELRQELIGLGWQFESASDTEVLLAAWKQWGEKALSRFTGMFVFVVYDRRNQTLTCVRDPFGIKPFFYRDQPGCFSFASEISALNAMSDERATPNWQRAYDYLVHGDHDHGSQTFFADVDQLLPGHILELDLETGNVRAPRRWWDPDVSHVANISFSAAAEELRGRFLENIRLHLRSDVPLGSALSGGIDSSSIVCAMRHVEPDLPIHTFSFIAPGDALSEEPWIDMVNGFAGATSFKVAADPAALIRDLDDMIQSQGEPFGSTSIYAQYCVYRLAKESGVTVTLDGQGADELLAGYSGYPGQRVRSLLENGQLLEAWTFLRKWSKWPDRKWSNGVKRAFGEMLQGKWNDRMRFVNGTRNVPNWVDNEHVKDCGIHPYFSSRTANPSRRGRRVVSELKNALNRQGIPRLLRYGDRNSMRFSVESRVPFLTSELAEFLLSLPEDYLISREGETKSVFREAMRGIVPAEILDRRDKIGFETPERAWLISAAETCREWLQEGLPEPLVNRRRVLEQYDSILAGNRPYTRQVWRWINFSRWFMLNFDA